MAHQVIAAPTITMEGDANGAPHPEPSAYAKKFSGKYEHRPLAAASGTTCRRKLRKLLPTPSSASLDVIERWTRWPSRLHRECPLLALSRTSDEVQVEVRRA